MTSYLVEMKIKLPSPLPTVTTFLIIVYLTLTPMPLPPRLLPHFFGWDKVAHFFMFGTLSAVAIFDIYRLKRHITPFRAGIAIAAVVLTGGAIELLQGTTLINRACDFPDFVANSLGAVILGLISFRLCSRKSKSSLR